MKYSLKTKEFKKRNNIFGQRRPIEDQMHEEEQLDEIKEITDQDEESKIYHQNKQDHHSGVYRYINFERRQENRHSNTNQDAKPSKHGLSPNVKPSLPAQIIPKISFVQSKPAKQNLSIDSNTISFWHYSEQTQLKIKSIKQTMYRLFKIICDNNQRIEDLEQSILLISFRSHLLMQEINYSLKLGLKLENKVELFLNTMRNVYEGLRISRLKQQNLELYFKQPVGQFEARQSKKSKVEKQSFQERRASNFISTKSKQLNPSKGFNEQRQSQELISLLQYQSDNSFDQNKLLEQVNSKIANPFSKFIASNSYESKSKSSEIHRKASQQTFKMQKSKFQKLSPFETNLSESKQANPKPSAKQYYHNQKTIYQIKQQPSTSMPNLLNGSSNYSFEISDQYDKAIQWLERKKEIGINCWLDEMNCLRRPNMTYIFGEKGEVITLKPQTFARLRAQGWLTMIANQSGF